MKIKLNTNKKRTYKCLVEEMDITQKETLSKHIAETKNLQPWLATFVERFHLLANQKEASKKHISDECNNYNYPKSIFKPQKEVLSQATLSAITCFESDTIRHPNINNLIALARFFDVSIDYLVGLSDCAHPQYDDINKSTGLSEKAITSLKLKKHMMNIPRYSLLPNNILPFNTSGELDVDNLPNKDSSGLYPKYYYESREFSKDALINTYNDTINKYSEIIPSEYSINLETDSPEAITQKMDSFKVFAPHDHFIDTLNILLTYKNGALINLISHFLFQEENKTLSDEKQNHTGETPFLSNSTFPNYISLESIQLSQIQTELIKIKNNKEVTK